MGRTPSRGKWSAQVRTTSCDLDNTISSTAAKKDLIHKYKKRGRDRLKNKVNEESAVGQTSPELPSRQGSHIRAVIEIGLRGQYSSIDPSSSAWDPQHTVPFSCLDLGQVDRWTG